jgi:hypothetical protein
MEWLYKDCGTNFLKRKREKFKKYKDYIIGGEKYGISY